MNKNTLRSVADLVAVTSLSACVTTSEITPAGPGLYMTGSAKRGGFTSDAELRAADVKRASAFCAGMGKSFVLKGAESSGMHNWGAPPTQNSQITFACE